MAFVDKLYAKQRKIKKTIGLIHIIDAKCRETNKKTRNKRKISKLSTKK